MSIKPQYQTQSYFTCLSAVNGQSLVECRFAQSQDYADVIAVHAQVSLSDCTVSSGRVTYGGRLVCTVVYADESAKLCRVQKGIEFTHYIDGDNFAPAQTGVCCLTCPKTQVRREGSALVVSAVVNADINVYCKRERTYLTAAEGAVCKTEQVNLINSTLFTGGCEVEDVFDADNVADVLIPSATPVITACSCRAGVVAVQGELALSLLAVRGDTPVCIERMVPFTAEIAADGALLGALADCAVSVADLIVTAQVDEERNKCTLQCDCALAFQGVYYEETRAQAVVDLFCPTTHIKTTPQTEQIDCVTGFSCLTKRVQGLASVKAKMDYSCAFTAVTLPSCEFSVADGKMEGAVSAVLLYEQGGEARSTEVHMPFSLDLDEGLTPADVAVCGVVVRQRTEGECEAEAVLKMSVKQKNRSVYTVISAVEEGEPRRQNDCAVCVMVPENGDGLWELSKKLLQSPDEVMACNPALQFPLTGKERIVIYRQKSMAE